MDPQQRLLLECTSEILHDSQHRMHSATGGVSRLKPHVGGSSSTGIGSTDKDVAVFVGASYTEYLQMAMGSAEATSTYVASGGSLSVLAGRISYLFGFMGPCTVVDTACSSSLVALNNAYSSLMVS